MILECVPEAPTKGVAGGLISPLPSIFCKDVIVTLSRNLFIKHSSSATKIQLKN